MRERKSGRSAPLSASLVAIVLGCVCVFVFGWATDARAQEEGEGKGERRVPAPTSKIEGPNPEIRELAPLDRLAGVWDYEATAKPSEWVPKGGRASGTDYNRWVLGGRFLQGRGVPQEGGESALTMPKALWMSTYDLNKQAYRMAFFDGDGNVSEWLGHWDDVARTLSWTCEIAPGLKADAAWRFTDKDRYEYTLMVKDESGKVYADLSAKLKRKGAVAAIPDDPAGRKPAVEVEGLAPLDAFTGVWSTETTLKPAIWTKNASTAKGTTRFRWALGGRYQLEESAVDPGGLSAIVVRGYDEPRKSIRCRHFDASGGMTEMTGVWDAAAKTLREQGKIGDIDAIIQFQWADDKIVDWTATAKDNAGKLYLDASGKMRRQP